MKRLICDMCKKEIEPRDAVSIVARGVPVGRLQYNSAVCTACEYDICNECFERIVNAKKGELIVDGMETDEDAQAIGDAIIAAAKKHEKALAKKEGWAEAPADAPLPYNTKR